MLYKDGHIYIILFVTFVQQTLKEHMTPINNFINQANCTYFKTRWSRKDMGSSHCMQDVKHLWTNGCLKFGIPMIWRWPTNQIDYFCLFKIKSLEGEVGEITVKWLVLHSDDFPVPSFRCSAGLFCICSVILLTLWKLWLE